MGLESGTYIENLVRTNPTGSDPRRQGDDHLRLIKDVLLNTFPSLDCTGNGGGVTATAAELNKTADPINFFPSGGIIAWGGLISAIPSGWALCDGNGTTTNGISIPDLTNRFIIGADSDGGGQEDVGDTGGSRDIAAGVTGSTALTIAQMPAHTHTFSAQKAIGGYTDNGGAPDERSTQQTATTSSTGSGAGHTHTTAAVTNGNLPPYYALAYIIKL